MHKSSIIQIVLIILGIVSFFEGLQYLLGNFVTLITWITGSNKFEGIFEIVLSLLLVTGCYFLLGYFFVSRSGESAVWIVKKSNLSSDIKIQASPEDILYFLFVIIGIYILIKELPYLLDKIFTSFTEAAGKRDMNAYPSTARRTWTSIILNVLLPTLTILFAKNLAHHFSDKISKDDQLVITTSDGQEE